MAPMPSQIRKVLSGFDEGTDSFAIFEKSGSGLTYMQTAGDPEADFDLEPQEGSLDAHFECSTAPLTLDQVVEAFTWYRAGDERWRTEFDWVPLVRRRSVREHVPTRERFLTRLISTCSICARSSAA